MNHLQLVDKVFDPCHNNNNSNNSNNNKKNLGNTSYMI